MLNRLMRPVVLALLALALTSSAAWAQRSARAQLSANGPAAIDVGGMGTASITIAGTYSGTVNFEVIGEPGTAAVTVDCATPAAPGTAVNSTTSTGVWVCPVAGLRVLQARMSSYVSGTALVYLNASPGGGSSGGGGSATASLTLQEADDGSIAAGQTADAVVNFPQMYNGSAWVRLLGNATDGLLVNLGANNDVTVTGTVTANLSATDNAVLDDIADGIAITGEVDVIPASPAAGAYIPVRLTDGSSFLSADTQGTHGTTWGTITSVTGGAFMANASTARPSDVGADGDAVIPRATRYGELITSGAGDPCSDHTRISSAAIDTSTSGNVEIVALNGSDLIYVCGYSVVAGAATSVQFIRGTGTACATGETDLTGPWSFAANGGITQANTGVPQFVVAAGNALCIENSGANAVQGHVTYVRTATP